jgi:hypothetical protein
MERTTKRITKQGIRPSQQVERVGDTVTYEVWACPLCDRTRPIEDTTPQA